MKLRIALFFVALSLSFNSWAAHPTVELKTNLGNVVLELYPEKAPQTVENFLSYVKSGFYKGTVFHRVVNRFVIQGGGLTSDLSQKPTLPPIPNEANNGLLNERGTLAMARTFDPDSATSQFFINLDSNKFLNHYKPQPEYYGYCVFGKVVKGMDIVEKIANVPTGPAGAFPSDVPLEPIVIEDVSVSTKMADAPVSPRKSKSQRKKHG